MTDGQLYRYSAFSDRPEGGNRAGVWVGERLPGSAVMQRIAAELGYSETVFLAPTAGPERSVRYYSPLSEVSFCGHATIAAGVHLGKNDGAGTYRLSTAIGEVPVSTELVEGHWNAALRSVEPRHQPVSEELLEAALQAMGWRREELASDIPPARAWAGAWHLVLAVAQAQRLESLNYDFEVLKALMLAENLTTLQLVWKESDERYHARNPFPVGGVVEDPATGAAAAALGGYLRDAGLIKVPRAFEIIQGVTMGRPSRLWVEVPATGGITVSGRAVELPEAGKLAVA